MGKDEEKIFGWLVLASAALLIVIAIFKIIFWISLVAILVGTVWICINFINHDHEDSIIPVVIIICGILLSIIAFQIGYRFETTPGGNQTIQMAKTILLIDNMRTQLPAEVSNEIIQATENAIVNTS